MLTPLGFEQITDLDAAVGLSNIPDGCNLMLINAAVQNVRFRDDGEDPDATTGILLKATDPPIQLEHATPETLKFIEVTSSAVLNVSYYKKHA